MESALHPIQMVVQRTALSAHVIRMWERRYQVVTPQRTASNRRAYSEADIERLALLGQLTARGQPISYLAQLSTEELRRAAAPATPSAAPVSAPNAAALVARCMEAVQRLDDRALEAALMSAETDFGIQGALRRVIAPLAEELGERWRDGTVTAAHEHFASAVLRTHLGRAIRPYAVGESSPLLVIGTPVGQLHELGALLAAAQAANVGWRVLYLGASLPAAELAGMARQQQARLVGLSIVYPNDDPRLASELKHLREMLPAEIAIAAGGRATAAYRPVLDEIGALPAGDLATFSALLDSLRTRPPAAPAAPA